MASESAGRLVALGVVVALLFGLLVGRLWQLQVIQGPYYLEQSEGNRLRDLRLPAPRGIVYDRKGRPLATNRAAFTVSVLPNELRGAERVLPRLAAILQMPEGEIHDRIARARSRPFEPVRLRRDAPKAVVAMVEENRLDLPGVIIEVEPARHYLYGPLAAHALGHLGEISPTELAAWTGYRMGDLVGKGGVERVYDRALRGQDGRLRVEVDARGRPLRVLGREPSRPGRSIVLAIDLDIQRAAEAALGDRAGAVVVLDPRTGEVLALASHPAYDPNAFAAGISARQWAHLTGDRGLPLLNRAVEGTYEPGSVFKIVTAAAALTRGTATRATRIHCPGVFRLGGWVFHDLKAHGTVDFVTGVAKSCNVFFWTLGHRTGGDAMAEVARAMGLGERTGIDLPAEAAGLIPSSAWKQRILGEPWYPGDNLNMAIGQGWVNVTPLQIARMAAAVGNGGTLVRPHLVREVIDPESRRTERVRAAPLGTIHLAPDALRT
ncbi:MAG: penicillin-binding protein 2, partial [Armatimonadetes bacterium]|nr:penicillin-binding protein 2 [Armatimonadota bacterium]